MKTKNFNMYTIEELKDMYYVTINGNEICKIDRNKKPCLSMALKQAKKGFYTELWYMYSNGNTHLIQCWN